MEALAQILRERTGLEVGLDRLETLRTALEGLSAPCGGWFPWLGALRGLPIESPTMQRVIELITVSETFFFRDTAQFEALERVALPAILASNVQRREIRVLSVGCATGEETYSLAILVRKVMDPLWRAHIVGADLCMRNLEFARQGIYRPWSFRGVAETTVRKYFTPHSEGHQILPDVRQLVQFAPLNVMRGVGPYVDALDLIVWRNMSIYFSPEVRNRVALDCQRALRPGGYLLVGASEIGQLGELQMEPVQLGQAWFYRRPSGEPPPRKRREARPAPPARRPVERVITGIERARQLADRGRYEQARAALCADSSESFYLLAQIEEAQGQTEAAEAALLSALKHDRDFLMAHLLVGLSYARRGQDRRAFRHLQRAARLLTRQSGEVPHSEGRSVEALRHTIDAALARIE